MVEAVAVKAPSTCSELSVTRKLRDHTALLRQYLSRGAPDFAELFEELAEFQAIFFRHVGRRFGSAVEIGYGPRPYRMRALHALGVTVEGVDAEAPVLGGTPAEWVRVLQQNGFERFAKSLVRRLLFDRSEFRCYVQELDRRSLPAIPLPRSALYVMDAAEFTPSRRVDLVYSINVFEHIELGSLERIVERVPDWLVDDGIALIRPDIWTGLHGGHALDWIEQTLDHPERRRSEPWEHLRLNRFPANTYLNKLARAGYRAIFASRFTILEEIDPVRGRAREFLTDEIRSELSDYSEEDLLDAQPLFVLRPR